MSGKLKEHEGVRFYELDFIEGLELPAGSSAQKVKHFAVRRKFERNPEKLFAKLVEDTKASGEEVDQSWDPTGRVEGRKQFTMELQMETHAEFYKRMEKVLLDVNRKHFGFDLTYWQGARLNEYRAGKGGHAMHSDYVAGSKDGPAKLAFSLILRTAEKGGDLVIDQHEYDLELEPGDLAIFPAYESHEVVGVKKGSRVSVSGWLGGPLFR